MIIMPLRLALAHRCSSQARQSSGTPQAGCGSGWLARSERSGR